MKECTDTTLLERPVNNRRVFIQGLAGLGVIGSPFELASSTEETITADEWISETLVIKASDSPLKLQRFREPIWVLLEPIVWKPSNSDQQKFRSAVVPRHFVTDFASIPRVFWSLMPRDDVYAYPAIVHDYLYWEQSVPKTEADQIFKLSMEDLEVAKGQVFLIHQAVSILGRTAWEQNAESRRQGEKRILKSPPPSARTKWSDWKTQPELFI